MAWLSSFLAELLARLIPWIFSGTQTQSMGHTAGVDGLDAGSLAGTGDLTPSDLPDI